MAPSSSCLLQEHSGKQGEFKLVELFLYRQHQSRAQNRLAESRRTRLYKEAQLDLQPNSPTRCLGLANYSSPL